jgi:transposase
MPVPVRESPRIRLRRLRRENSELKRANALLKSASAFLAAELDRPSQ